MVTLHAVYLSLGDAEFLEASIRSVYDHVAGITVVTTYDRDWKGRIREPDGALDLALSPRLDPAGKIEVAVLRETSEARARSRAMDLAAPGPASRAVRRQHETDHERDTIDYFLVVDPDEIWESASLERLRAFAGEGRAPVYRVGAHRYFRRWTHRIDDLEWSTALVRADVRLTHLRNRPVPRWRRGLARLPGWPARARARLRGFVDVPPDVAVFHHGSYIGPRARIAAKLASFGHADEVRAGWLEDVYDRWTTDSVDFHPVWPRLFPSSTTIPVVQLPREIRSAPWPAEYLA
jgi:hypothetical protein